MVGAESGHNCPTWRREPRDEQRADRQWEFFGRRGSSSMQSISTRFVTIFKEFFGRRGSSSMQSISTREEVPLPGRLPGVEF